MDLVVRARRVVTRHGERPAAIGVRAGRIVTVADVDARLETARHVVHGDDVVVLPGVVDTHVHVQDPGHEAWETFATATRAAAAGGVTTLVDMPVDCHPVTTDAGALAVKRTVAAGACHVDVGFWGGLTPLNLHHLPGLADAGVLGFKTFLSDPGLPGFPPLPVEALVTAGTAVAGLDLPLLVHAEWPAEEPTRTAHRYADHLAAHPAEREVRAVEAVVAAARRTGCRMHVVHVSSARSAELVAAARADGVPVSAETCPHLLVLSAEEVPDGAVEYGVGPPLRGAANAEALWAHLLAGDLDLVVSDHSPTGLTEASLEDDFASAAPGIASVQLSLPLVWTGARARGVELSRLATWMCSAPAELAGLDAKGQIAPGKDADLVVLAPDETFVVEPGLLHQKQTRTPYTGRVLHGVVRETWLRGVRVEGCPSGRLLSAGEAA